MSPRSDKLNKIRAIANQTTESWQLRYENHSTFIEADGPDGAVIEIAEAYSQNPADVQLISGAPDYIKFLLELLHEAFGVINDLKGKPKPKQPAAECAIMCGKDNFKRFLVDKHGLKSKDKDAVDNKVREILGINSRKILDTDNNAQNAWKSLKSDFNSWLKEPIGGKSNAV